jgi:hypothetical protein
MSITKKIEKNLTYFKILFSLVFWASMILPFKFTKFSFFVVYTVILSVVSQTFIQRLAPILLFLNKFGHLQARYILIYPFLDMAYIFFQSWLDLKKNKQIEISRF